MLWRNLEILKTWGILIHKNYHVFAKMKRRWYRNIVVLFFYCSSLCTNTGCNLHTHLIFFFSLSRLYKRVVLLMSSLHLFRSNAYFSPRVHSSQLDLAELSDVIVPIYPGLEPALGLLILRFPETSKFGRDWSKLVAIGNI